MGIYKIIIKINQSIKIILIKFNLIIFNYNNKRINNLINLNYNNNNK
jgi:hypothetical protein